MGKTIGFLAGAIFTAGLILTCGGGSGLGPDADSGLPQGGPDGIVTVDIGVGEAHAQTPVAPRFEYATFAPGLSLSGEPWVWIPSGVAEPQLSACQELPPFADAPCLLNRFGAEGWELVAVNTESNTVYILKRAK